MLGQVLKFRRIVVPVLVCAFVVALSACSSQPAALVSDPDDHGGSQMPWNKQEQWENGQNTQAMTDRR
jgi:starvation-inducible outer membrane lipoprotein